MYNEYSKSKEKKKLQKILSELNYKKIEGKMWCDAKELHKEYREGFIGCGVNLFSIVQIKKLRDKKDYFIDSSSGFKFSRILYLRKKNILKKLLFNKNTYATEKTKWNNGKIYRLCSFNTNKVYVGSTHRSLEQRYDEHRAAYLKKKQGFMKANLQNEEMMKRSDCWIYLLEDFPCNTSMELRDREQYWIKYFGKYAVNTL